MKDVSISQVSVFLESRPGHLRRILDSFEAQGIDVRGVSASDTGDYGIVRFVLDDPQRGLAALRAEGSAVALSEVLCVRLDDVPGELARVVGIISDKTNIVYSYSLASTFIVFGVEDPAALEALLVDQPVEVVGQAALAKTFAEKS
ncbi:MAG: amino acid-binding protein [Eggerthellaceae bacterium]|nr:amino acid-binding protein [Eggerthellaceae bacterium]